MCLVMKKVQKFYIHDILYHTWYKTFQYEDLAISSVHINRDTQVIKKECCFFKELNWYHKWQCFIIIILSWEKTCSLNMKISGPGRGNKHMEHFYRCHFKSPLFACLELSLLMKCRLSLNLTSCPTATHSTDVCLTVLHKTSLNISKIRKKWC